MKTINLTTGSEKKFFKFISNLNEKDKIAILTHTDLDGIASAKITNEVIQADIIKFIDYEDLNKELIKELVKKKINKIIITDISLQEDILKELEEFKEILWIDHHIFQNDPNSEKLTFINKKGNCAAYLCYELFSKAKNLEYLDWLASAASISDWTYFNNKEFMEKTFNKYGDKFEISEGIIKKAGLFWDLQWKLNLSIIYYQKKLEIIMNSITEIPEISKNLEEKTKEIEEEINRNLRLFEKNKLKIKDGYFFEFSPKFKIGSIVSTLISVKYRDRTIITARPKNPYYSLSARRQDKSKNMSDLLKYLVKDFGNSSAGGHPPAAGGHILLKDKEKFIKNLTKIMSP